MLSLLPDEKAAQEEAKGAAFQTYPEDQGWGQHQIAVFEVPQTIEDNGYRLTWHAEELK